MKRQCAAISSWTAGGRCKGPGHSAASRRRMIRMQDRIAGFAIPHRLMLGDRSISGIPKGGRAVL